VAARWRTRGCTGTTRLAAPRRAGVSIFLFVYVLPLFVDKVFTPFVARARKSVPRYQILLLIIGTHIFFPPVFITTTPIIWLAAWMFSFWEAIGLLFGCNLIKFGIPFWIGRKILPHRIARWSKSTPRFAAAVQVIESQGPLKTIVLLRLSISDYVVNYICSAVDPKVMSFTTYMLCSVLASIPGLFISVLTAREIVNLKDMLQGSFSKLSRAQIASTVLSYSAAGVIALWALIFGRRHYAAALRKLREQQQRDAAEADDAAAQEEEGSKRGGVASVAGA